MRAERTSVVDRRRRGTDVYYYRTRSGRKVDFIWRGSDGRLTLVQVAFRAPDGSETLSREMAALREALEEQSGSRAVLSTMDDERRQLKTSTSPPPAKTASMLWTPCSGSSSVNPSCRWSTPPDIRPRASSRHLSNCSQVAARSREQKVCASCRSLVSVRWSTP